MGPPTWTSSKLAQVPSTLGSSLFTVVCTEAPLAAATRFRSSSATWRSASQRRVFAGSEVCCILLPSAHTALACHATYLP